jgi:hypothetical protein
VNYFLLPKYIFDKASGFVLRVNAFFCEGSARLAGIQLCGALPRLALVSYYIEYYQTKTLTFGGLACKVTLSDFIPRKVLLYVFLYSIASHVSSFAVTASSNTPSFIFAALCNCQSLPELIFTFQPFAFQIPLPVLVESVLKARLLTDLLSLACDQHILPSKQL